MTNKIHFFLLLLLVASCTPRESVGSKWRQENGKLKVLTTIAMINDVVQEIGGEEIDTIALVRGELDPHSYELVKGDDEKFARADLVFYNGLGLEHGLSLRQNLNHHPHAIAVAEILPKNDPKNILYVDGEQDPHVWMDIALWMQIITPIVDALVEKDPEHASLYRSRGDMLRLKMQEADKQMYATMQAIPSEKRFLVTSHDAFHYFARHYLAQPNEQDWQKRCKAPEGLAPEAQMSISDVIEVIEHIEAFQISVLFPESNVSKDSLRKIVHAAKEKGFSIRLCQEELYGDSMGDAGSYLEMIAHNVAIISRELQYEPEF